MGIRSGGREPGSSALCVGSPAAPKGLALGLAARGWGGAGLARLELGDALLVLAALRPDLVRKRLVVRRDDLILLGLGVETTTQDGLERGGA